MSEHPGKRSDPGRLQKEQQKAEQDRIRRQDQFNVTGPKGPELPKVIAAVKAAIAKRMQVKRDLQQGYGSPPQQEGARVVGNKRVKELT